MSSHKTLAAAVRAARKSDRLCVQHCSSYTTLYVAECRNDEKLGYGRFGNGPDRHEPSLREAIAAARQAAQSLLPGLAQ